MAGFVAASEDECVAASPVRGVRMWVRVSSQPGPKQSAGRPSVNARRASGPKDRAVGEDTGSGSNGSWGSGVSSLGDHNTPPVLASSASVKKPAWPSRMLSRSSSPT